MKKALRRKEIERRSIGRLHDKKEKTKRKNWE